jgi:hypothetical protein
MLSLTNSPKTRPRDRFPCYLGLGSHRFRGCLNQFLRVTSWRFQCWILWACGQANPQAVPWPGRWTWRNTWSSGMSAPLAGRAPLHFWTGLFRDASAPHLYTPEPF